MAVPLIIQYVLDYGFSLIGFFYLGRLPGQEAMSAAVLATSIYK
jgi:Na+-driven multidrug efflux pump